MAFGLNRIGQIALGVKDADRAEVFYRDALGLRLLYRFGDLTFFDCCGVPCFWKKPATRRMPALALRSISTVTISF